MAPLMILVSIEPTDIMKLAVFVYFNFIHISDAATHSFEFVMFRFYLVISQSKSVFSQLLLFFNRLLF